MAPLADLVSAWTAATPALVARQATTTVIQTVPSQCSGQYSGGVLAGAILGTFFGTILVLYLFTSLQNQRPVREEVVVERKVRRSGSRRRRRSRSASLSSGPRRPSRVFAVA